MDAQQFAKKRLLKKALYFLSKRFFCCKLCCKAWKYYLHTCIIIYIMLNRTHHYKDCLIKTVLILLFFSLGLSLFFHGFICYNSQFNSSVFCFSFGGTIISYRNTFAFTFNCKSIVWNS